VKDHDAALGVRSFQIRVRISEVLISAMWHPGVLTDPAHRWLRRAVITVCRALIRIDERRKSDSQEVGENTLFSSAEPQAVKGKVQKGERLLPRSRRAKAGEEAGLESGRNRRGVSRCDFAGFDERQAVRTKPAMQKLLNSGKP
jgi:hypothetical protein